MEEQRCSSCGAILFGEGNVVFKCPKCHESEIGRCSNCRDQSVTYVCKACGFEGP
ncbi:MAG: zinc finger domain-containing protein [Thermoplasmata archaeon]